MPRFGDPLFGRFRILLGIAISLGFVGCDRQPADAPGADPESAAQPDGPAISPSAAPTVPAALDAPAVLNVPAALDASNTSEVQKTPDTSNPARLYLAACGGCHQIDGNGQGSEFPPLAGSAWVAGDESQLIKIMLHGLRGPIRVKERVYSLEMAPVANFSDEELAVVATYVRQNFGNQAPPVAPETVAKLRAEFSERRHPWTADELDP